MPESFSDTAGFDPQAITAKLARVAAVSKQRRATVIRDPQNGDTSSYELEGLQSALTAWRHNNPNEDPPADLTLTGEMPLIPGHEQETDHPSDYPQLSYQTHFSPNTEVGRHRMPDQSKPGLTAPSVAIGLGILTVLAGITARTHPEEAQQVIDMFRFGWF